jgi:hypothetical protein
LGGPVETWEKKQMGAVILLKCGKKEKKQKYREKNLYRMGAQRMGKKTDSTILCNMFSNVHHGQ